MTALMTPARALRTARKTVVNHSGGKDSTIALRRTLQEAERADALDELLVVHNDLSRMEWPGTAELDAKFADHYREIFGATLVEMFGDRPSSMDLARKQAEEFGIPFYVRSRLQGDLLEQVEQRGMWPSAAQRYCTSDHKRGPKHKFFTELTRAEDLDERMLILDINGERAEESPARARKPEFELNERASNKTKREVWTWRIVHSLTLEDVWREHREQGMEWHWVYEAGMSRLSCSFCVLGSQTDLRIAVRLRPDLAAEYAAVEQRIGHTFKNGLSMRQIIDSAAGALPKLEMAP